MFNIINSYNKCQTSFWKQKFVGDSRQEYEQCKRFTPSSLSMRCADNYYDKF